MGNGKTAVKKHRKTGIYIAAAAAAMVLLCVNWLAQTAEKGLLLRADMTREQSTVLSGGTKTMLRELKKNIYIYLVGAYGQDIITDSLLQSYDAASPMIHYSVIDEKSLPHSWADAGAVKRSIVVSDSAAYRQADAERFDVIDNEQLFEYGSGSGRKDSFRGENAITPAILYVAGGAQKRAVFIEGDGIAPYESLLNDIKDNYYEAVTQPENAELDPENDALIVISPRQDISNEGFDNIKRFLDEGGSAAFFTGAGEGLHNITALLSGFGISIGDETVLGGDPVRTYRSPANIVPHISSEGEALGLSSPLPVLGCASPITVTDSAGAEITPLLWTDESCFLKAAGETGVEKEPGDAGGSYLVGALAEKNGASIAVVTSSSFVDSEENYSYSGNSGLFIGILRLLCKEIETGSAIGGSAVSIGLSRGLDNEAEPLIFIAAAGLLPLAVLAAGFARWRARQKQ